ncbi:uncharacterized protein [Solanum tuberosum]|uniref:uncharacterized protein n=1 Tax=Solanum tuberosum TaxID=4113 RepID=UPI00073A486E|nr:PREDICTED: uncharacterized protein LOC107061225 [Solanum tuberosum]
MVSKKGIRVDPSVIETVRDLVDLAPILTLPEKGVDFTIYRDASGVRLGGVLMYKGKVIAYVSSQLKSREKNCPTHDLEVVAVSLQNIFSQRDLNLRQHRLLELLKFYDITILYHPEKANVVADSLSMKTACIMSLVDNIVEKRPLARDLIQDKVMRGETKENILDSEAILKIEGRICVSKVDQFQLFHTGSSEVYNGERRPVKGRNGEIFGDFLGQGVVAADGSGGGGRLALALCVISEIDRDALLAACGSFLGSLIFGTTNYHGATNAPKNEVPF